MNIELIRKQLTELSALTDSWVHEAEISAIERDLALDKVKRLYEELRLATLAVTSEPMDSVAPVAFTSEAGGEEDEEESQFSEIEVELTYYEGEDDEDEEEEDVAAEDDDFGSLISLEDIHIIDEIEETDEPQTEEEPEAEPQPEPMAEPEPTPAPEPMIEKVEEPHVERVVERVLFDINEIPIRQKSRRSAILSLYSDGPQSIIPTPSVVAPTHVEVKEEELIIEEMEEEPIIEEMEEETPTMEEEPIVEEIDPLTIAPAAPSSLDIVDELIMEDDDEEAEAETNEEGEEIEEEKIEEVVEEEIEDEELDITPITIAPQTTISTPVLGETLYSNVETIADRFAQDQMEEVTISQGVVNSSINDRYLIAQGLFGGDMSACDDMLDDLDAIENFDDCMIYIVENYDWDPDDEATKLVLKLLEQRFPLN